MIWIFVLLLLLFGAKKLPGVAKGIGQSLGEFKKARDEFERELRFAEIEAEQEASKKKVKKKRRKKKPELEQPSERRLEVSTEPAVEGTSPEEPVPSGAGESGDPVTVPPAGTEPNSPPDSAPSPDGRP